MLLRRRLDLYCSYKTGIIVLLIGVLILGVGFTAATSLPTYTTTNENVLDTYTLKTHHSSVAVAVNNSSLYTAGERVNNRSTYFRRYHKQLEVNITESHNRNHTVSAELVAVNFRETTRLWSENISESSQIYTYNNSSNSIVVNIEQLAILKNQVGDELPSDSKVYFMINVTAPLPKNASQSQQQATVKIWFNTKETYRVNTTAASDKIVEVNQNTRVNRQKTTQVLGKQLTNRGLGITGLGLIIIVFSSYFFYYARFDDRSVEELLYRYHLEKYNAWITLGRPFTDPELQGDEGMVKVNTLEGLVHIAVDSETRVIYSERLERFYVFNNNTVYMYTPPVKIDQPYATTTGTIFSYNSPGDTLDETPEDENPTFADEMRQTQPPNIPNEPDEEPTDATSKNDGGDEDTEAGGFTFGDSNPQDYEDDSPFEDE